MGEQKTYDVKHIAGMLEEIKGTAYDSVTAYVSYLVESLTGINRLSEHPAGNLLAVLLTKVEEEVVDVARAWVPELTWRMIFDAEEERKRREAEKNRETLKKRKASLKRELSRIEEVLATDSLERARRELDTAIL